MRMKELAIEIHNTTEKADDLWRLPPFTVEQLGVQMAQSEIVDWGLVVGHIPAAHLKTKGKGIRVGVCDTGKPSHPDLAGAIIGAEDFTGSQSGPTDKQLHAHHVCGIIGARANDQGIIGVAPECEIITAKVLGDDGSGSSESVSQGIRWCADQGCDIVNLSLGSSQPDQGIKKAIQYARSKGVWIICAAGNSGPGENTVDYPGRWEEVIAVSATNKLFDLAKFSSRGVQVDVAAPGQDILSTYSNGSYARLSGTSMACPYVTGATALLLSYHKQAGTQPPKTVDDMIAALTRGSKDAGKPGRDDWFGSGILDAATWFSENPAPTPVPTPGPQPIPDPGNGGIMTKEQLRQYIGTLIAVARGAVAFLPAKMKAALTALIDKLAWVLANEWVLDAILWFMNRGQSLDKAIVSAMKLRNKAEAMSVMGTAKALEVKAKRKAG